MKIHHILAKSISKLLLRGAAGVLPFLPTADAGDTTWTGGGASNVWGDAGNWGGTNVFTNYGTVIFNTGGTQGTTSVVNGNISQNGLRWTGSSSWTLNNSGGAVISLFDNGGTQAKVENQSTGLVTLNAPITFAATSGTARGEINAVSGDLTFGSTGTLTVSGSAVNGIAMFGSGHTITFSDTINAATKWFGFTTNGAGNTAVINGTVTSGDWYVMNNGTLNIGSTGNMNGAGAIRLGGDFGNTGFQDQTKSGTLQLTSTTGGQTFSNVINSTSGNTSGALAVNSLNSSGTNTLSGHVALDSALKITQTTGGILAIPKVDRRRAARRPVSTSRISRSHSAVAAISTSARQVRRVSGPSMTALREVWARASSWRARARFR